MFLILYSQNQIITLGKMCRITFFWKKMRPKSLVLQLRKKLQILEKKISRLFDIFQDKMKAFDDFKNKEKNCMK